MKKIIALFLLVFSSAMQAQTPDNFVGNWLADDGNLIQIYTQDAAYFGKINDTVVLIQMVRKSDTQLYGGTFYDEEGKTEYEAKLKVTDSNTIVLKILNGLSTKRIVWHRVPLNWQKKAAVTVIQH